MEESLGLVQVAPGSSPERFLSLFYSSLLLALIRVLTLHIPIGGIALLNCLHTNPATDYIHTIVTVP